eukprot:XP_011666999.1 PREDICTED: dehydrogenase/reductase SDR family member 11-like [Strongylocentrotus purpuratus]
MTDKRRVAESVKTSGVSGEVIVMECDVANESAVKSMYANAENKFGGVDVSVQCAGLSRAAPLLSGDANDWKIMQEVNVLGTLYCCREAVNLMKKNGVDDGVLINLVSLAAYKWTPKRDMHFYGATKVMLMAIPRKVNVLGTLYCCREAVNLMKKNGVDDGVLINLVSLAAYKWTPNSDMHFYGATKVMLMAIQEGLRQELRGINSNIRISGISPGQGNTGFYSGMFGDVSKSSVPLLEKVRSMAPSTAC